MPQGNVGTPTKIFIDYINQCIMPQSLISKLGLNIKAYKKHKKKIYSNVQYNYTNGIDKKLENFEQNSNLFAMTASGHKIDLNIDDEKIIKQMNYSMKQNEIEANLNKNKENIFTLPCFFISKQKFNFNQNKILFKYCFFLRKVLFFP